MNMKIEVLLTHYTELQNQRAGLQLMRSNGQTGVAEQARIVESLQQKFTMECQAFDDALKIALTSK